MIQQKLTKTKTKMILITTQQPVAQDSGDKISCHAGQHREVKHDLCVTRGLNSFTCYPHRTIVSVLPSRKATAL